VMAARAGNGQSEELLRHHINPIVDDVVRHAHETITNRKKAKRRKITLVLGGSGQLVSGKLLDDEDIVRLVFVETANHIIAISPCKRIIRVLAVASNLAFGVAVASRVQPVPSPTFAILRR